VEAGQKRHRQAEIGYVGLWGPAFVFDVFDSDGVVDDDEVDSLRCKRARFSLD
jgi:hypothetical protein